MATKKSTTTTTTTTTTTEEVLNPLVPTASLVSTEQFTVLEGQVFCSSLKIAEHFEKRHDHVLRDIESVIAEILAEGGKVDDKFSKGEYEIVNNLGHKVKKPSYLLTRNGFMVLVMGYQGQKAMKYKLQYIAAFDQMETYLKQLATVKIPTITREQYKALSGRIGSLTHWLFYTNSSKATIENALRFKFNASSVLELPVQHYQEAMNWLDHLCDRTTKEYLPFMEQLEKHYMHHLCESIPFTPKVRQEWEKRYESEMPKTLTWKEAALQLEASPC